MLASAATCDLALPGHGQAVEQLASVTDIDEVDDQRTVSGHSSRRLFTVPTKAVLLALIMIRN